MADNWTAEQKKEYAGKIRIIVQSIHGEFSDWKEDAQRTYLLQTEMQFQDQKHGKLSPYVNDRAGQFEQWFRLKYLWDGIQTPFNLTCEVTKRYGSLDVTFGATNLFVVGNETDRSIAYSLLHKMVQEQFSLYETENLVGDMPAQQHNVMNNGNAPTSDKESITVSRLTVRVENGKVQHRINGGKYEKYGVPLYPEDAKRFGIDLDAVPITGLDLPGYTAEILLSGGKPKKVLELYK